MNQSRAERRRAIVLGRVRVRGMPPHFWLWAFAILAASGVIYWKIAQGQLESAKGRVMAKQRAIAQTLGPKIVPFRDQVETWAMELAADPWLGDLVTPGVDREELAKAPGVYLRLRAASARTPSDIRTGALRSLHDGFTSCFFVREAHVDISSAPACRVPSDCEAGLLCNEWNVCTPPPRPYNMRLAYRALRVLSPEWTDELHLAGSELGVNGYERDLEKVTKHDVPIAIELLTRAKYVTIVLDEEPPGGLPEAVGERGDESEEERIQRVPHAARVGIWALGSNALVARVRATAEGAVVPVGERVVRDERNLAAQKRQANSCALALQVKRALEMRAPEEPVSAQ